MSNTKSWAICNRDEKRLLLNEADGAFVEFGDSGPGGQPRRFALTGISATGLSFNVTDGDGIARGATFADAVVRLGSFDVRGPLEIVHVTEEDETPPFCGARFDPASEGELRKLKEGMKEIEDARSR